MLFLSYAEEDRGTAAQVAGWFRDHGYEVYDWWDSGRRAGRFIEEIESAIQKADAFIALLSPSFMRSPWCRRERELAMHREHDRRACGQAGVFIYVLRITGGEYADAGFLRSYAWETLKSENTDEALGHLTARLGPASRRAGLPDAGAPVIEPEPPLFRNRRDELDRVLRGLGNASGPHFWLVIAPPQLGKTWFLDRISAELTESGDSGWLAKLIDMREQPPSVRRDARAVLGQLFDPGSRDARSRRTPLEIATAISQSGKSHLCLIDSAELLDQRTAQSLRTSLGQIYRFMQNGHQSDVRLAVIVASRQEDKEWRGVNVGPRLCPLPLTEFKPEVVELALRDLATQMRRTIENGTMRRHATAVYGLSEGLPALLVECLRWIRRTQWLTMQRMGREPLFVELAHPYVQNELLTLQSLLRAHSHESVGPLQALQHALRILAPYRLFTQSHLRYHLDTDADFNRAVTDLGWQIEDLGKAISGTALLLRPLDEPWQEIHAAIRRLLYHYYYKSDDSRAAAHREARKFVESWAAKQHGKEQVIGLVESLWHEAAVLRLTQPTDLRHGLCESARMLVRGLQPSPAYTVNELREYAADRLTNDEEFREAIARPAGLHAKLIEIIAPA